MANRDLSVWLKGSARQVPGVKLGSRTALIFCSIGGVQRADRVRALLRPLKNSPL